ncbi:MAG: dehydrogenase [Proteobacteria bacterium]|nr:dehydrogenase [Pseudomonadota bacterium]
MLKSDVLYRARAPLRLSFGGGGSELPPYVHQYGGVVLNATIGRYVYASIRAANTSQVSFVASDCNLSETLPVQAEYSLTDANIALPLHRAVYNRIINTYNDGKPLPLTLHTYSDAPVGSGLGTSSTLTVAMLRCFDHALGLNLDVYELAALAHDIERCDLNLAGGYQDHYAATFGGFNFMEFRSSGEVVINPLALDASLLAELEYSLVLYYTSVSRASADIIEAQSRSIANEAAVCESVHQIKALAFTMKEQLLAGEIRQFAKTLHNSWLLKRSTASAISNHSIDEIYQQACANGAWGGKISGAGGGGFMMLIVDPNRRQEVINSLPNYDTQASFCHFSNAGAIAWQRNG